MTLNERLLGDNPYHNLVLCCFVTFVDFFFFKKNHICLLIILQVMYFDMGTSFIIQGTDPTNKDFNKKLDDFLRRED